MNRALWLLLLPLILATANGCAERPPPVEEAPPPESSQAPGDAATDTASEVEYAVGWAEISMITGGAKVTIDVAGHFDISRNGCWRGETGVIRLEDWNTIAKSANAVAKLEPLAEDTCFERTTGRWHFDGIAELKLNDGAKRPLYDATYAKICTRIRDPEIARELLAAINRMLPEAFAENCPSARGT